MFHGNLTQFLYAACVGLFLGYVYCKTGKVLKTVYLNPGVILLFVISIYGIIADLFNLYIDLPFFGKR